MSDQPTEPEKRLSDADEPAASLEKAPSESPLGASLEPVLCAACEGRLSTIRWFRTDWQRGGALTGYAHYESEPGCRDQVVVKMPIGPVERQWLVQLQPAGDVAPRVFAHGDTLGGYDIAWVIMEMLPYGPLSSTWGGAEFDLLVDAAARFYSAADGRLASEAAKEDWKQTLARARESAHVTGFPDSQRWNTALKKAQRKLKEWTQVWADRPTNQVCHGDLHPGNAMTRNPPPQGPAVLFDYALTRRGHWTEDAVYLEHLYWAKPSQLSGRKLCNMIARARKANGLEVTPEWPRLATVRRAMLALSAPLRFHRDSDEVHLRASLEVLEVHTS